MRHRILPAILVFVVLGLAGISRAAESPPRMITVTGTMVTQVAPDLIRWSVTLSETDVELGAAKARSDTGMKKLLGVVHELGVVPEDLQTGYLNVEREFDTKLSGSRVFKDWLVRRTITFKQRDLARFDEYFTRLIETADVEVSYGFENSKYHELRAETRLKAVNMAKQKAQAMCDALGVKLGTPVTIQEGAAGAPGITAPWFMENASNAVMQVPGVESTPDGSQGTFAAGQIEIRESVNVTFGIE